MVFGPSEGNFKASLVFVFQFPLGIRWCSDGDLCGMATAQAGLFQFPLGIRWCSDDHVHYIHCHYTIKFQFPLGIRWCSDRKKN